MTNKKATVNFFYFSFDKDIPDANGTTHTAKTLSYDESKSYFNSICQGFKTIQENHKAKKLQNENVLEIISFNGDLLFAKIGHQNPSNTLALRDKETLSSSPLNVADTKSIETFTYFLMDFSTNILAYLTLFNAPKVSALREFFCSNQHQGSVYFNTSVIFEENILKKIMTKDIISKVELKVAIPSDDVLENSLGISRNDYASINDLHSQTATFHISAKRNRKLFGDSNAIKKLFNNAHEKYNEIFKFSVSARNEDEKATEYDLISSKYTKSVDLGVQNVRQLDEEGFREILINTYNNSKQELNKLTRT